MGQSTEQLIAELSGGLTRVRPLRPPIVRALQWLALASLVAAALLLWFLRHARPIVPLLDLSVHVAAVGLVLTAFATACRRLLS